MAEPSLDEIFSEEFQHEDVEEPTGETETEEEVEESTEETEAEATEEEAAPPAEETDNRIDPKEFKGYLDEREKRQNLQRELDALKEQIQAAPTEPEQLADPVEDAATFAQQLEQRIEQKFLAQRFQEQRQDQSELHEDYAQAEEWANSELGNSNIPLQERLRGVANIPKEVYRLYSEHKQLQEIGSVDSLKSQLAEAQAELDKLRGTKEAEAQAEQESTNKTAATKPSLTSEGTSKGIGKEGDLSLEDLLGTDFNNRPK